MLTLPSKEINYKLSLSNSPPWGGVVTFQTCCTQIYAKKNDSLIPPYADHPFDRRDKNAHKATEKFVMDWADKSYIDCASSTRLEGWEGNGTESHYTN